MDKLIQYSEVNADKFTPEDELLPDSYHYKQFDRAFYGETLLPFQKKNGYLNRRQLTDNNCFQVSSNVIGLKCQIRRLGTDEVLEEFSASQQVDLLGNPYGRTYQFRFKLSDFSLPSGYYYFALEYDYDADGIFYHLSEPIWAKVDWPGTLLIECSHNKNDFSTAFVLNPRFNNRIPGFWMPDEETDEDTQFTDQQQSTKTLDSKIVQRIHMETKPIPLYVKQRLNQAFRCASVSVEGVRINKDAGAEWETPMNPYAPLKVYTLKLQYYDQRITHTFNNTAVSLLDFSALPLYISSLSMYDLTSGQPIILSTDIVVEDSAAVTDLLATWTAYESLFNLQGTFGIVGDEIIYQNGGDENFEVTGDVLTRLYEIELASASQIFEYRYKSTGLSAVVWSGITGSTLQPSPLNLALVSHDYGGTGVQTVRLFHNQTITNITIQGGAGLKAVTDLPSDAPTGLQSFLLTGAHSSYVTFDMTKLVPAAGLLTFTLSGSFTSITFPYSTAPTGSNHLPGLRTIAIGNNPGLNTADIEGFLFNIVNYLNYSPGSGFFNSLGSGAVVDQTYKNILTNSGWFVLTN